MTIGTKCPNWVNEGFDEYVSRLNQDVKLELVELPLAQRPKNHKPSDKKIITQLCQDETARLLNQVKKPGLLVVLDKSGESWSTETLAAKMQGWQTEYPTINLLVGGPDGHASEALAAADCRWSLSKLTFPHPLVRVLLAEQIYRAWSLLKGHPYHK